MFFSKFKVLVVHSLSKNKLSTVFYRSQRSWGKVIFSQASVILSTECMHGCSGHAWLLGGMCGCWGACMIAEGACMVVGGACVVAGGMCGCQGPCMVARGCVWLLGGMHGCREGMCGCGGCVWLLGGIHGCGGACIGYDEI